MKLIEALDHQEAGLDLAGDEVLACLVDMELAMGRVRGGGFGPPAITKENIQSLLQSRLSAQGLKVCITKVEPPTKGKDVPDAI
jgi:hypothetical protein